jgi:hypothetical protein
MDEERRKGRAREQSVERVDYRCEQRKETATAPDTRRKVGKGREARAFDTEAGQGRRGSGKKRSIDNAQSVDEGRDVGGRLVCLLCVTRHPLGARRSTPTR